MTIQGQKPFFRCPLKKRRVTLLLLFLGYVNVSLRQICPNFFHVLVFGVKLLPIKDLVLDFSSYRITLFSVCLAVLV
jgi:hypothetical protein